MGPIERALREKDISIGTPDQRLYGISCEAFTVLMGATYLVGDQDSSVRRVANDGRLAELYSEAIEAAAELGL